MHRLPRITAACGFVHAGGTSEERGSVTGRNNCRNFGAAARLMSAPFEMHRLSRITACDFVHFSFIYRRVTRRGRRTARSFDTLAQDVPSSGDATEPRVIFNSLVITSVGRTGGSERPREGGRQTERRRRRRRLRRRLVKARVKEKANEEEWSARLARISRSI